MKNNMACLAMKNMLVCLIVILPLWFFIGGEVFYTSKKDNNYIINSESLLQKNVVLLDLTGEYCDIRCFLAQKKKTIEFLSMTFGVDNNIIIKDLIEKNKNVVYDEYNIGRLQDKNNILLNYDSFEKGFIEYLIIYCKNNPSIVNNSHISYTGDSEYIIELIKYFSSIYNNVDYLTAVSIGAAESGYYKVSYMLKANNIYGGMSSKGLMKYKNIEYGVLSYIRMLSINYYAKGLTTLESIGRVYCPTFNESGIKVASSHWINLVTKAKEYYKGSESVVTVDMLIDD